MRAALAVLPVAALLAGSCGGDTESAGLVTVVPGAGPGGPGWSLPVQLTVAQNGRRVTDFALGHTTDIQLPPGTYVFALYDEACPATVKVYRDEHVLLSLTLYEQDRCHMTVSLPVRGQVPNFQTEALP